MQIVPRSVIGTPEPPTTRPRLSERRWLLAHEVGVDTPPNGRYRSADPARVLDDARAAAAYGISTDRPWEYNYMVGLDGRVFEQAGDRVAAHCLNWNAESVGVLFLNATDVRVNAAQIESWWALRDSMVARRMLTTGHQATPHYRFRKTSCCGINAEVPGPEWNSPTGQGRLGNLIPALLQRPAPPPTPEESTMYYLTSPKPGTLPDLIWTAGKVYGIASIKDAETFLASGAIKLAVSEAQYNEIVKWSRA